MTPPHADTAPAPPSVATRPEAASLQGPFAPAELPAESASASDAPQQVAAPAERPRYVGRRRRLPPDAPLFVHANLERQLALPGVVMQVSAEEEAAVLAELSAPVRLLNRAAAAMAPLCRVCGATLPSAHLLSLHVAEVHDSFFAAQVARRLKVFQCLLEACGRRFATAAERKQHLIHAHAFPKSFDFERMHMRSRKGQVRPAEPLQRYTPKPGRSYGRGGGHQPRVAASRAPQPAGGRGSRQAGAEADALADDLAQGLGGLGRPPPQITFGRSRHHAPLRARGRGGGRGGSGRGRASVQLD